MPGLEGKILDRYQLQRLIGRGGMADVYEGHSIGDGRAVAVKVFKGNDEDLLRRFIREARLMSSLHNDHLLRIYASGDAVVDGYPRYFIAMPLMSGGTLRARIRRASLPLEEACQCLRNIADALDYIHRQGVIHRDIKSSNVLLDDAGNCYLADFGIARDVSESTQLTTTGSVLGTVDYVAPELFLPGHKADDRSDLYSLGVLLFEMVTGQLPFAAESQLAVVSMHLNHPPPTPSKIDPQLSSPIDLVILRAMDKNPDMRYPSASALAEAFDRAIHRSQEAAGEDHAPQIISIGGAQQLVLPPVPSAHAPSTPLRPAPLSNATETAAYVPQRPEATLAPPPDLAPISRREARFARRSRYARLRFRIALFIALFFLAIIVVFSIYAVLSQSRSNNTPGGSTLPTRGATIGSVTQAPTATPNLTATAQANVNARATATAAAIAHATAVAEANAAATAGVIQTATSGAPAYQDALNNPNNPATQTAAWDTGSQCSFSKDGYHVQAGAFPNLKGCRETGFTYLNAAISVHVTILSGHSGGLFFRLSTDPVGEYDGYLFEIDTQGHYKISTINNGSVSALQDWTFSAALKQGYAVTNTLQVIMQDNEYLFYVNGNFLTVVTDSTYSSAGNIGFVATTNGGGNADVLYTDLSVYNH
jgi:serine/threonine protein kinase